MSSLYSSSYINSQGEQVDLEHYYVLSDFYEDRAAIALKKGAPGVRGFINNKGRVFMIDAGIVSNWKNYSDGLCAIELQINGKNFWTYIDLYGKRATNELFHMASQFVDGKALVLDLDNNLRVIDKNFNTLTKKGVSAYSIYAEKMINEHEKSRR